MVDFEQFLGQVKMEAGRGVSVFESQGEKWVDESVCSICITNSLNGELGICY